MAILMGVLPGIFLRPMEPAVTKVVDRVRGSQPSRVSASPSTTSSNAVKSTAAAEPK
jgi:hypothetical protein